ncbi:hypothetical protein [Streptomyces hydrogenans]
MRHEWARQPYVALPAEAGRGGIDQDGAEPAFRQLRGYPAADQRTPSRAAFTAGVAYGLWGVRMSDVGRLALLTEGLTAHVAAQAPSRSLLVIADYDPCRATVLVIALGGATRQPLDPRSLRHVREGDTTGVALYAIGPAAYVRTEVSPL